jgi:hypothetical protein
VIGQFLEVAIETESDNASDVRRICPLLLQMIRQS